MNISFFLSFFLADHMCLSINCVGLGFRVYATIIAFLENWCVWLFDFVLLLSYKQVVDLLVGIIYEDLEERPRVLDPTLIPPWLEFSVTHANFPPTLIELFGIVIDV